MCTAARHRPTTPEQKNWRVRRPAKVKALLEAKLIGLVCSIERLARRHSDDYQQRQRKAFHQGLDEFGGDETGIRIIGVVAGSNERPLIQLHREVKSGDEETQSQHPFPANQSAAAQHDQHRKRRADQEGVGNQGDRFDEIIRRAQPRIGPLPSFRNFQELEIAAGSITLDRDL